MWHIYTMEYSSAIKKDEVMLLQQHGGPRECHTEWSKLENEKCISFVCGI